MYYIWYLCAQYSFFTNTNTIGSMVQCLWWPCLSVHTAGQPVAGHVSVASNNSPDATGTNGLDYAPERTEMYIFRHYAYCAIWHGTVMQIYI